MLASDKIQSIPPLALLDTKSCGYCRLQVSENREVQARFLLLLVVLLAFLGGLLLGRSESTPVAMATLLEQWSEYITRDPELSVDQAIVGAVGQKKSRA